MKNTLYLLLLAFVLTGCKTDHNGEQDKDHDDPVAAVFEANSKTVMANLEGWQNENLDYSMYAGDFYLYETAFSAEKDSLSLEEMKAYDKEMWANYDFKMVSEAVLLPGVKRASTEPDGSVRHYPVWEVTKPATDSTEARTGTIRLYESFDFNEEGKILRQQVFGDFTGLMMYLHGEGDMMEQGE
ncbi:MAG: hypothetical protein KJO05_04525 [Bacteroidia bacterium]|nr:hypothetical protein [Bacteroidia bacterium]NNF30702.1 hypothetical protein [Flavobacteriaceae bacterium]MBT8277253.1 hypothetical protein [Bacteroidia bacterium]NNJ80778.1 hypothetical protein [Flavobacteriaceae bacterium]NNK54853.1 hypothetical protein [Flavobacteriaceae bacterium]